MAPVVVVGGGLAGLSFAGTLRRGGYAGPLSLVCDEEESAYDRPPLSKGFIVDGDAQRIRLADQALTEVQWHRGRRALGIDLDACRLQLDDGQQLAWGTLVLATGARPRELRALDALQRPVLTLRTLADARRIRELLQPGRRLLLVGAGVIGLELAATARGLGVDVCVIEAQPRVMARGVSPRLSQFIQQQHLDAGVTLQLGRVIAGCEGGAVLLDDGSRIEADVVVVGVGVVANDELASKAGLRCKDGIFVDGHGRSSAKGVLAVGDVARQVHPISGQAMRIETWSNAQNQATAAARSWLQGCTTPYTDAPWYWSDQYSLRLQSVGLACGQRELLRGDLAGSRFSLLQLDGRRLVGAACVNHAKDFGVLRKIVGREFQASDAQWGDPAIDLRKLA
jgi:3-phenylpropionate/trans-cinnamate dioxygenase ferredoxin reductase subunit